MKIVTLTTDFGTGDFEIGTLSGVIWRIAPATRMVDLTHDVPRHNIYQAALVLDRCTPFFPAGTIHTVVVDPGVGTNRRPVAACLGDQWFVGPDNGVMTLMYHRAISMHQPVEIVHTNRPEYWLSDVSHIFHGRDVFAPVAGHLAAGVPLSDLGDPVSEPVLIDLPKVTETGSGLLGQVTDIDHFGNLGTNLHQDMLKGLGKVQVLYGGAVMQGLVKTFGDARPGELVALIDSSNYLSISLVNGSAADRLGASFGDPVEVRRLGRG
jgi:S-adenosylmethionine hydrolase